MNNLPFVELVDIFDNHFCYDVNTNTILQIPEDEYEVTKNYCNTGDTQLLQQAMVLNEYVQNGFFSSFRPYIIEHSKTNFIKSYLYGVTEKICLQLTKNCNFKCRYCGFATDNKLNRNPSNEVMSFEVAKKAIDILVELCSAKNKLNVGFYGGEPFLQLRLIEDCVNYCESQYPMKEWSFSVTTNGSICNDKVVKLINKHNFTVTMSLDGPQHLHDKNRRWIHNGEGTFEKVYENYQYLRSHINDKGKLRINSVVDQEEDFGEYIDFFETEIFEGIKRTQGVIDDIRLARNTEASEEYMISANKGKLKEYIQTYLKGEDTYSYDDLSNTNYSELFDSFSPRSSLREKEHHNGPCLPGAERLFVSSNGVFYPCEKCSENSEAMKIGSVFEGFDYDKIQDLLNVGKITENECKNCFAIRHCTSCAQKIVDGDELNREMKLYMCEDEKRKVREKIRRYVFANYFLFHNLKE